MIFDYSKTERGTNLLPFSHIVKYNQAFFSYNFSPLTCFLSPCHLKDQKSPYYEQKIIKKFSFLDIIVIFVVSF